jgi:signal transduction histidine kinase
MVLTAVPHHGGHRPPGRQRRCGHAQRRSRTSGRARPRQRAPEGCDPHELVRQRAAAAKLIEVGDAERTRIERNLHDGAQQGLIATGLALSIAGLQHDDPAIEQALGELEEIGALVRSIAHGVHPNVLAGAGLAAALESISDDTPGLAVGVRVDPGVGRLPNVVEISAYEMVREAVTNAAANAAGSVNIDVRLLGDQLPGNGRRRRPRRRFAARRPRAGRGA